MKNLIILIFFISFALFAEEPAPTYQEENHEGAPHVSDNQTLQQKPTNEDFILNSIIGEMREGRWLEERPRGPVFNTCSTWEGAVQCIWTIFRMDNLSKGRLQKHAHLANKHLTAENLKQELSYIQAFPDSITPLSKAWFLLLTVEFIFWSSGKGLPDPHKLIPMANTFSSELLTFIQEHPISTLEGLQRGLFPFILYALHSYMSLFNTLSKGTVTESLQELNDLIKAYFFHRNDNGPIDQTVKTRACSLMKRAGIHRDYLEEKGLLLPGYEEFEKRTAREDIQRVKSCETEHETITFSGGGPGEPKDIASTLYYANVLLLLKKTGGDEAVRHFLRHNPIPHGEFALSEEVLTKNPSGRNGILILYRFIAISILNEIYDDPEWQITWQIITNNHSKTFVSKKLPTLEFALFSIFASTEPHLLNRQIAFKE